MASLLELEALLDLSSGVDAQDGLDCRAARFQLHLASCRRSVSASLRAVVVEQLRVMDALGERPAHAESCREIEVANRLRDFVLMLPAAD